MEKHIFTISGLTDTKFSSRQDKAKVLNDLADFVRSGFEPKLFTKKLYTALNSMFGHIAHYDIHGFYNEWFRDESHRLNWLYYVQENGGYGDPEWTWSDVESTFKEWLKSPEGNALILKVTEAQRLEEIERAKAQYEQAVNVLQRHGAYKHY